MSGTEAVIVAATRSPIGRAYKGSLVGVRPDDLAALMVRTVLDRIPALPASEVEDVVLGCGLPGGEQGFNIARVVAVLAGLRDVPGLTVSRYCASGLQAVRTAAHAIRLREGTVFIAGGVECASRSEKGTSDNLPDTMNPRFDEAAHRTADRTAGGAPPWTPEEDLPDVYIAMGQTAENVAQIEGVTREEQDAFALRSQQLAVAAVARGHFDSEITPVELPDGTVVARDDGPRPDTSAEGLAGLRPVFRPDGTVTAGNACPLNDGAAAMVLMSANRARELGLSPLARIVSTAVSALDPEIMGLGPVAAGRIALTRAGLTIPDIDVVEINEAFAAQVIPSARQLEIDIERLNVSGGAIALGHPFGMTGIRLLMSLVNNLTERDETLGMAALCVGGGQGMAVVIERMS
ncbi:MAG: acetyl-CoA C-acetyltransferase [Actinomycetota bacterium]|nr:acetyl-CoA C-acetyltransferase [Actinomycetota bacterium]